LLRPVVPGERARCGEHRVRSSLQSKALESARNVGVAVELHRTVLARQVLDVVTGGTIRIDTLDVDHVARSGRDVLDRQAQLSSEAPLVFGMARKLSGTEVRRIVVMRSDRRLEQTPSLIDTQRGNEIRNSRPTVVTLAEEAACTQVVDASLIVGSRILGRNRERDTLTEVSSVGELVDTSDRAAAADETVEDVARIVHPRRGERRDGLTHREPGELDEGVVDAERTAGDAVTRVGCMAANLAKAAAGPGERRIPVGANHAVLGLGA